MGSLTRLGLEERHYGDLRNDAATALAGAACRSQALAALLQHT